MLVVPGEARSFLRCLSAEQHRRGGQQLPGPDQLRHHRLRHSLIVQPGTGSRSPPAVLILAFQDLQRRHYTTGSPSHRDLLGIRAWRAITAVQRVSAEFWYPKGADDPHRRLINPAS